jgi:hypothetical protein
MAGLIRGGLVDRTNEYGQPIPYDQQLGQAYQMACEMDSSLRGAKTRQTRRKQVKLATNANRNVASKTAGVGADDKVEDIRPMADSLSDLYDRLDRSAH